jgi:hypothetical protein
MRMGKLESAIVEVAKEENIFIGVPLYGADIEKIYGHMDKFRSKLTPYQAVIEAIGSGDLAGEYLMETHSAIMREFEVEGHRVRYALNIEGYGMKIDRNNLGKYEEMVRIDSPSLGGAIELEVDMTNKMTIVPDYAKNIDPTIERICNNTINLHRTVYNAAAAKAAVRQIMTLGRAPQ